MSSDFQKQAYKASGESLNAETYVAQNESEKLAVQLNAISPINDPTAAQPFHRIQRMEHRTTPPWMINEQDITQSS